MLKGKRVSLRNPLVMAVINLTPDSFYENIPDLASVDATLRLVETIAPFADILDLGAVSTRPGAVIPSHEEELKRLLPHLEAIVGHFPQLPVSVDTFRAEVARRAVNAGAAMINDVSGGELDAEMFETIANLRVPYVLMHMKGTPADMQVNPFYHDIIREIMMYFSGKVAELRKLGVPDIIIDPGFGFGKTPEDNYRILKHLDEFSIFELPLLVGFSRKSMIQKVLDIPAAEALNGTTVLNTIAVQKGAHILRVHDAREAKEICKLTSKLRSV